MATPNETVSPHQIRLVESNSNLYSHLSFPAPPREMLSHAPSMSLVSSSSSDTVVSRQPHTTHALPDFHIRLARISDVHAITCILALAFFDEDAVGRFMHPAREQHPASFRRYWRRRVLRGMLDYRRQMSVAIVPTGSGKERIVGVVDWADYSPGGVPFALLSSTIAHVHLPNRAATYPRRLGAYERAYPKFIHPLVAGTPVRAACLALDLLAVDPEFQGQGIGRAIVLKGLKQAEKEGRGVCVVCADGKETFYSRCGFGGSVGRVTEGEGNPLGGVRGGEVKFWWPKEFKIRGGSSV